jgi:hypothetical protein
MTLFSFISSFRVSPIGWRPGRLFVASGYLLLVTALALSAACGSSGVDSGSDTPTPGNGSDDPVDNPLPPPGAPASILMGIPDPGFCVSGSAPVRPASWPSAAASGYYYVDGSAANRTDNNNTWGYPDLPRATIPASLPAGSYVEVHGNFVTSSTLTVTSSGTSAEPVWIRGFDGASRPTMSMPLMVRGTHVIVENLLFDMSGRTLRIAAGATAATDHVCVRDVEFAGPGTAAGNNAVISISGSASYPTTNVALYRNVIHDFGDRASAAENDYHGILPGSYANYVWVLNNHVYNMGGDSIQVGQATYTAVERPNYVYVGGNTFHNDRENAVDIKSASDVVVSRNMMYGYVPTSSSAGEVVVIHNEPDNVWILYNDISNGSNGIITTGSTNTWFIGNVVHAIHHSGGGWDGTSLYAGGAALHFRASAGGALFNTLYDYDIGLQVPASASIRVLDNIFAGRAGADGMDVRVDAGSTAFDYNLLYGNAGIVRIGWGGTAAETLAAFQGRTGQCAHCPVTADPQFANAATNDFRISSLSPATNAGALDAALADFQARYGIALDKDILGNPRVVGATPDIGAYESDAP